MIVNKFIFKQKQVKIIINQVYYIIDAMGNKLRTNYYNKDSLYYYNDGIEYKGTVNPKLYYIATEDGYIDSTLQYNYYLKDHLGNIRKVLNATTRTVTQTTNYYPFGLATTTTGTSKNKYLYNGKEIQPSNGYYDYGARMYDASVGRWFVVDALAEKYFKYAPYIYTLNNPIKYIDPNGEYVDVSFIYEKDKEGKYKNPNMVKAFEAFAKSDVGKDFLGKFAHKGQEIAGHKYTKSGDFDKSNINLGFGTFNDPSAAAKTSSKELKGGGLNISIKLEEKFDKDAVSSLFSEIGHEAFLHAELDAYDYMDDKKLNQSNIENDVKNIVNQHIKNEEKNGVYSKKYLESFRVQWEQHIQTKSLKVLENKLNPILKQLNVSNPNKIKEYIKYD